MESARTMVFVIAIPAGLLLIVRRRRVLLTAMREAFVPTENAFAGKVSMENPVKR
jgi:hypothetical protein